MWNNIGALFVCGVLFFGCGEASDDGPGAPVLTEEIPGVYAEQGVEPGADLGVEPEPGGPPPPYGLSMGMTAPNFANIPDCNSYPSSGCTQKHHSLHQYYNKYDGVIIALLRPG